MNKTSELKRILGETFIWNKARLDCFANLLLALFAVRTVNLSEIALAFASKAKPSSRYKRLQRFFKQFKFDYVLIARWIFYLFFCDKKSVYLCIDRSNWFLGKTKINIFVLGVAYEGLAIPLFWSLLPKAGNSNFSEQRTLITRFLENFPAIHIAGLLADREFASSSLFGWLQQQRIPFYIRIKEGSVLRIKKKKLITAKQLFKTVSSKHTSYPMTVWIFDHKLFVTASRSETGELMVVATNAQPTIAIAVYLRRWEIECLFQSLKHRGFRFEDTHMISTERIEKLMALLAIGFAWAHKVGEWQAIHVKPILFKKHWRSFRPQNNFFRSGFDFIRELILNPFTKFNDFKRCLANLIPQHKLKPTCNDTYF